MLKIIRSNAVAYLVQQEAALGDLSEYVQKCIREMLIASIASVLKCWFDSDMQEPAEEVAGLLDTFCAHGVEGFTARRSADSD